MAPVLGPAIAGCATFLVAAAIALHQMARSNRPHELTRAPLVALIQLVSLGLLALALVRLERAFRNQGEAPVGRWHWLLLALLLPLTTFGILFLFGAASAAVEVLRS